MRKTRLIELGLLFAVATSVTGVAWPMYNRARDNDNRLKCLDNLRKIGEGIKKWSLLHDYALPPGRGMSGFCNSADGKPLPGNLYAIEPGLNALWDKGRGVISDPEVFRCPGDPALEPPPKAGEDFTSPNQLSYGMTGNIYPTDLPNKVIVADKSDKSKPKGAAMASRNHNHRCTNVLFFDGSVRSCERPYLPPGVGSEIGSIYVKETGTANDTYIE